MCVCVCVCCVFCVCCVCCVCVRKTTSCSFRSKPEVSCIVQVCLCEYTCVQGCVNSLPLAHPSRQGCYTHHANPSMQTCALVHTAPPRPSIHPTKPVCLQLYPRKAELCTRTHALACTHTARTHAHTHTHTFTHQRLIDTVGTGFVNAAPHTISAGVGPNTGAVRGRSGHGLRNIPSFSFGFTPEIKGWREKGCTMKSTEK